MPVRVTEDRVMESTLPLPPTEAMAVAHFIKVAAGEDYYLRTVEVLTAPVESGVGRSVGFRLYMVK